MDTVATFDRSAGSLREPHARIAGVLYVLTIVFGISAVMLERGIIVSKDAAATAANISAHPDLYRLSFVGNLLGTVCYVMVTALFYELFKPVNRSVSLVAAFLSLIGCSTGAVSCGLRLVPTALLNNPSYAEAYLPAQVHALVLLFVKAGGLAYATGMIFFGFYCVLIGYLTLRSTFLPKILGILFALAGFGWLTFLIPQISSLLSPVTMSLGLVGEGSLGVWLLVKGVDLPRWQEMANTTQ